MSRNVGMLCLAVLVSVAALLAVWNHNRQDRPDPALPGSLDEPSHETPSTEQPVRNLPLLERLPHFSLTDSGGQPCGTDELTGRALIVSFIASRDDSTTPTIISRLGTLAQEITELSAWPNVRLVCISVDPKHDTPEVLRELAGKLQADQKYWKLLTGTPEQVQGVQPRGLRSATGDGQGDRATSLVPSPQLVLVDPQGDVRGFYDAGSSAALIDLRRDLSTVIQERLLMIPDLLEPRWMQSRRAAQLATASQFPIFCDFQFTDRLLSSGIQFRHRMVDDGGRSYVTAHYDHGNGVVIADVDGDGREDIFFVSQVGGNELWRNLGGGQFENITKTAGVALAERIKVTASFADIDNDGDPDLFVTTVRGGNVLFENDGSGKFTDITERAGVGYSGHSSGAVFFDYDRDGWLDLFLVNVGMYTTEKRVVVESDAFTGPDRSEFSYYTSNADAFAAHLKPDRSERSVLYHNLGGQRFVDVSEETGLVDDSWSGDAQTLDGNDDGWPDLYLVNMQGHDEYYENIEGKKFVKKSREVFPATPWGAMGIKVFDFDNDGRQDIYVTDMHTDMRKELGPAQEKQKIPKDAADPTLLNTDGNHVLGNALFRKLGPNQYEEVSEQTGVETFWPWGPSSGDLNADGFEDLFVAAGMNFPFRYGINSVLLNDRGQRFLDSEFILGVEPRRGGRTATPWFELDVQGKDRDHPIGKMLRAKEFPLSRAVVWGSLGTRSSVIFDVDGDGDLDIVTNEFNSPPMVLISNLAERQAGLHFLKVKLKGTQSNRDGLGATVIVRAGDTVLTKVHDGKSGYLSQSAGTLYFGLGAHEKVDRVEVRWPSGQSQTVTESIELNQQLEIVEVKP